MRGARNMILLRAFIFACVIVLDASAIDALQRRWRRLFPVITDIYLRFMPARRRRRVEYVLRWQVSAESRGTPRMRYAPRSCQ